MKRLHLILATLALAAIAVAGYSQAKSPAHTARAAAPCDGSCDCASCPCGGSCCH